MSTRVTPTSLAEWNRISLSVASRAFSYAQSGGIAEQSAARSGYMKFSDLERLDARPKAPGGAWWWIFTPLLRRLLKGTDSPAILVALGHHTWRGPGKGPGTDDYKREWLGFLAEDMDQPARREALLDLCNFTALHNSVGSFAQEDVLLTSALLESLNKSAGSQSPADAVPSQVLQPLLCDFTDIGLPAEPWPMLRVNWSRLWQLDPAVDRDEFEALRKLFPITGDHLDQAINGPDEVTPRIPSAFRAPEQAAGAKFHLQYQRILERRANQLMARETAGEFDLDELVFGHPDSVETLGPWGTSLPADTKRNIKRRLLKTILWFRDFAGDPFAVGKPKMARLLSSPVWLPENVPDVATISIVAYLRDSVAGAEKPSIADANCAAIVNAFRSGSSVVIRNTGIATGFVRAEVSFGHELDLLLGAVEKEIQSPSGKISFAYLTMFRRVLGLRAEEPMPELLAAWFTKEKLGEAVFRLAYPRALERGWVPENAAYRRWTSDELWKANADWICYDFEFPPWLTPDSLRGRQTYRPEYAYVAFWVLFLLVSAQGHAIDYAFPINVRDRWDGTALREASAQIALKFARTASGWEFSIENLGNRSSQHPDVLRCSSQIIIAAFGEREIGNWKVRMEPFTALGPKENPSVRWRAKIRISVVE